MNMKLTALLLLATPCLAGAAIISAVHSNGDAFPNATSSGTAITGQVLTTQQNASTVFVTDYLVPTLGHSDFSNPATARYSMTDRRHAYAGFGAALNGVSDPANFPAYLLGLPYVMTMNTNRDNLSPPFQIDITTNGPGTAYLFIDTRLGDALPLDDPIPDVVANGAAAWIAADGWLPMMTGRKPADFTGTMDILGNDENLDGTINNYYAIYSRQITGNTFTVNTFGEGRNMYGVAFAAIPEPSAAALGLLGGLALLRRRRN
jgi:MYXO-CTERM domain-containing protein